MNPRGTRPDGARQTEERWRPFGRPSLAAVSARYYSTPPPTVSYATRRRSRRRAPPISARRQRSRYRRGWRARTEQVAQLRADVPHAPPLGCSAAISSFQVRICSSPTSTGSKSRFRSTRSGTSAGGCTAAPRSRGRLCLGPPPVDSGRRKRPACSKAYRACRRVAACRSPRRLRKPNSSQTSLAMAVRAAWQCSPSRLLPPGQCLVGGQRFRYPALLVHAQGIARQQIHCQSSAYVLAGGRGSGRTACCASAERQFRGPLEVIASFRFRRQCRMDQFGAARRIFDRPGLDLAGLGHLAPRFPQDSDHAVAVLLIRERVEIVL